MVLNCCLIEAKGGFSVKEGNSTNTCIHASPYLKQREPQLLFIIPIDIIAYTFAL